MLGASSGFYIRVVFHLSQKKEGKGSYSNGSRFETAEYIPWRMAEQERPRTKAPNLSVLMTHSAIVNVIRGIDRKRSGVGQVV